VDVARRSVMECKVDSGHFRTAVVRSDKGSGREVEGFVGRSFALSEVATKVGKEQDVIADLRLPASTLEVVKEQQIVSCTGNCAVRGAAGRQGEEIVQVVAII